MYKLQKSSSTALPFHSRVEQIQANETKLQSVSGLQDTKNIPRESICCQKVRKTPSSLNKIQRTMPGGYLTSSWTRGCTQNNFLHTEVFPNQILTLLLTSCPTNFTEEKSSAFCFSRTIQSINSRSLWCKIQPAEDKTQTL